MNVPLFLLPGWCLGQGPLRATAAALGARLLDLPGHGTTPLVAAFDDAVCRLADSLPERCALGGWSLGALLAVAIAARHPEKIARLVLVAGTASFVARPDWPHGMPADQLAAFSAAAEADIEAALPRFVGNFCRGDRQARSVLRTALALADPRPPLATLATGLAWLRDTDLRGELAAVACPALLVHGAADPLMPPAAAEALADLLPDARLALMEGCAHAPFLSDPEAFQRHLGEFLS